MTDTAENWISSDEGSVNEVLSFSPPTPPNYNRTNNNKSVATRGTTGRLATYGSQRRKSRMNPKKWAIKWLANKAKREKYKQDLVKKAAQPPVDSQAGFKLATVNGQVPQQQQYPPQHVSDYLSIKGLAPYGATPGQELPPQMHAGLQVDLNSHAMRQFLGDANKTMEAPMPPVNKSAPPPPPAPKADIAGDDDLIELSDSDSESYTDSDSISERDSDDSMPPEPDSEEMTAKDVHIFAGDTEHPTHTHTAPSYAAAVGSNSLPSAAEAPIDLKMNGDKTGSAELTAPLTSVLTGLHGNGETLPQTEHSVDLQRGWQDSAADQSAENDALWDTVCLMPPSSNAPYNSSVEAQQRSAKRKRSPEPEMDDRAIGQDAFIEKQSRAAERQQSAEGLPCLSLVEEEINEIIDSSPSLVDPNSDDTILFDEPSAKKPKVVAFSQPPADQGHCLNTPDIATPGGGDSKNPQGCFESAHNLSLLQFFANQREPHAEYPSLAANVLSYATNMASAPPQTLVQSKPDAFGEMEPPTPVSTVSNSPVASAFPERVNEISSTNQKPEGVDTAEERPPFINNLDENRAEQERIMSDLDRLTSIYEADFNEKLEHHIEMSRRGLERLDNAIEETAGRLNRLHSLRNEQNAIYQRLKNLNKSGESNVSKTVILMESEKNRAMLRIRAEADIDNAAMARLARKCGENTQVPHDFKMSKVIERIMKKCSYLIKDNPQPMDFGGVSSNPMDFGGVSSNPMDFGGVSSNPMDFGGVSSNPLGFGGVSSNPLGFGGVSSNPLGFGGVSSNPLGFGFPAPTFQSFEQQQRESLQQLRARMGGAPLSPVDSSLHISSPRKSGNTTVYHLHFDDDSAPQSFGKCHMCSAREGIFLCGRCRQQWYCTRECQLDHWPTHMQDCVPSQEE